MAHGLSGCVAWVPECVSLAVLQLGVLVPQPGIEPTCPALQGRLLTGKSLETFFDYCPWGWCARISWVGNQGLLLNILHCLHHEELSRPEYQQSQWRQSAPGESLMELLSESYIAPLGFHQMGPKKANRLSACVGLSVMCG